MSLSAPPAAASPLPSSSKPRGPIIDIQNFSVKFQTEDGVVSALDRVSLQLRSGETIGILGESGSGKTTLALSIMALLPPNASVEGEIKFQGETITAPGISGRALLKMPRRQKRILTDKLLHIRWRGISMVFQGSMNAFNPVYTIQKQIAEVFHLHTKYSPEEVQERVVDSVRRAGLDPAVLKSYPHELSGGMKQRAVIAMALALHPKLVIADEPTTGLDVVIQARLIHELKELRKSEIESMIVISHDIGVIAQLASRVVVMYAGRMMEMGTAEDIYLRSTNPYTRALTDSYPSLARARTAIRGIPGAPPDLITPPPGCRFAPRCHYTQDKCRMEEPPLIEVAPGHFSACHFARELGAGTLMPTVTAEEAVPPMEPPPDLYTRPSLMRGESVTKYFNLRGSQAGALFSRPGVRRFVHAVDHIDFDVFPGEVLGIVGESGSGKTTIGRVMLKLVDASGGRLVFRFGGPAQVAGLVEAELRRLPKPAKEGGPENDGGSAPASSPAAERHEEAAARLIAAGWNDMLSLAAAPVSEVQRLTSLPMDAAARLVQTAQRHAGVTPALAEKLHAAGYKDSMDLAAADPKKVAAQIGIPAPEAERLVTAALYRSDVSHLGENGPAYQGFRRMTQMIFQDPYDSLDPNMTIYDIIEEPLIAHRMASNPAKVLQRIQDALTIAQLRPPSNYLDRYPHELSGGERQRVSAARALVTNPSFLVADEPISSLDVSLRAGFLNLLKRLRLDLGTTIVYVTHDIASARYVADRILVMYLGSGVEMGPSEEVIRTPLHPYTKALIQAVPLPTPRWNPGELEIKGEIGNAIDVPKGCRFAARCIYRQPKCDDVAPPKQGKPTHWYLCHFTQDELRALHPLGGPTPGAGG
jgi:oligopeptide/dipeptide ABC transporter ATP-binding protein